ncbi:hypothetical protein F0919_11500 [Taibaiella lutea]|uniref:C1q domain-containing protein n=1 Tax=Taibaiella lutea TaxID=2608001 RepID=A0A5M6CDN8_9BACT|nr:hypothetical protein [Taibaiella lutea]KAA5533167.1 hypothetical protein F0919_11500 [Taibaiella lutea]
MKNNILKLALLALLPFYGNVYAQSNNLGVGTSLPGSKLTVNGSLAAAYQSVTANAYSVSENDFYIIWNGSAAGTATLPASTTGIDRKGRLYFFKNNSGTYTLTIAAAGTELIDNGGTITILPGETALLVKTSTNTAAGTTYEVAQVTKNKVNYIYSVSSSTSETHAQGVIVTQNYSTLDLSTNGGADFNLTNDTWTCPQTGYYKIEASETGSITGSNLSVSVALFVYKNGTSTRSSFYNLVNFATAGSNTSKGDINTVLYLTKNDQIFVRKVMCNGCGATNMSSVFRQMIITGL